MNDAGSNTDWVIGYTQKYRALQMLAANGCKFVDGRSQVMRFDSKDEAIAHLAQYRQENEDLPQSFLDSLDAHEIPTKRSRRRRRSYPKKSAATYAFSLPLWMVGYLKTLPYGEASRLVTEALRDIILDRIEQAEKEI